MIEFSMEIPEESRFARFLKGRGPTAILDAYDRVYQEGIGMSVSQLRQRTPDSRQPTFSLLSPEEQAKVRVVMAMVRESHRPIDVLAAYRRQDCQPACKSSNDWI